MSSMLPSQVAGRHGSYATQFWRASVGPHYRDRTAMRVAYSRKAINRRLVLPLDSHNWVRSLEVLGAGYARLGRTPEHYQAVLRDMVEHHGHYAELAQGTSLAHRASGSQSTHDVMSAAPTPPSSSAEDVLPAIDALRDKAYAGDIPSNGSLWVTLVWSYCTLQKPQEALDTFHQATRRFRFSNLTLQHMAELLLPVLCSHGDVDEATQLYDEYLNPNTTKRAAQEQKNHNSGQQVSRSRIDDRMARRWLAEAAARQGDWKATQRFSAADAGTPAEVHGDATNAHRNHSGVTADGSRSNEPTINSLFHSHESAALSTEAATGGMRGANHPPQETANSRDPPRRSSWASQPVLSSLSDAAVRRLFQSLCREATSSTTQSPSMTLKNERAELLTSALACWEHLYGPLPGALFAGNDGSSVASSTASSTYAAMERRIPPVQDVHELLNTLASHGRWEAILDFFTAAFLHRPSSVYLAATPDDLPSAHEKRHSVAVAEGVERTSCSRTASATLFPYADELSIDAVTLNLVFACLPTAADPLRLRTQLSEQQQDCSSPVLTLPASACPFTVVRLLDDLLLHRDDMELTDVVMAVVGPALLQVGQSQRLFELLARTPMMVRAREQKAVAQLSEHERELKSTLFTLGYAAYALCDTEAGRHDMVRRMPHLFPPEVVRCVATAATRNPAMTPSERNNSCAALALAVLEGPVGTDAPCAATSSSPPLPFQQECGAQSYEPVSAVRRSSTTHTLSTASLLDLRWQLYNADATLTQQSRTAAGHRRGQTSAATLTSLADDAMRRDFLRLQETRHDAFTGSHADANRDPRPTPIGLHDHASGWDFFGRGGEKVFANHKRTPHPFTMRPKVMRDLRNPYRGWNPRQNSSLAHRENVIKWNGKSAV
jgi:hypothetical protein